MKNGRNGRIDGKELNPKPFPRSGLDLLALIKNPSPVIQEAYLEIKV
jgi:hypothetical protein